MKSQYLALEATITIAFSVAVALGVITSFLSLRDTAEDSIRDTQAEVVQAELRSAINRVKEADTGSVTFDLPEDLGGDDYTVSMSDRLFVVSSGGESFRYSSGQLGESYDLSGSARGGAATLSKTGSSIRLLAGR